MSELISVVVPTYNRADLIVDALDSVYVQNYRPIELIVVDDGSTDDTVSVIKKWATTHTDPNFKTRTVRQANAGGNPARNNGIEHATGKYIAFLDSDDAWLPEKLGKQLLKFDAPEVGAVYCGVQHMDFETGRVLEPSARQYAEGDLLEQLLVRDVTVQTSAYIVRKEIFDTVGSFDTALLARQDWEMWIRIAAACQIASVPEILVNFREHEGERTASNPQKEIDAYRMIRKKHAHLLNQSSIACRLRARAAYYKRMGRVNHKQPSLNSWQGACYAIGALLNWPFDFDNYAALAGMLLPAQLRQSLHRLWNTIFGATRLAIRSH